MRILVTGAGGMLGLDVQSAATKRGHEVVGLARRDLDISDTVAVANAMQRSAPDAIINCAAYTKVDAAEQDVEGARLVNGVAPGVLGAAAAAAGAWVVHVSTDYVFDGTKTTGPYVESDPTAPQSVYGLTKLEGEQALAAAAPSAHTIVRSSWLFGVGGPCFPTTILRAAASRPELKVVNDQVGAPTYTPHLAKALLKFAERRDLVGIAHVAAAGETTWFGFAAALVGAAFAADADTTWAAVEPCTTAEYPLPARRPAFSLLRSERLGVPLLPDWLTGMTEFMMARATTEVES